jgi:hypothetical protein
MKLTLTAIVAGFAISIGAANAAGTQQEQAACSRDAVKFCRPFLSQGDLSVLSCLQQNRPRLSKACKAVLLKNGV